MRLSSPGLRPFLARQESRHNDVLRCAPAARRRRATEAAYHAAYRLGACRAPSFSILDASHERSDPLRKLRQDVSPIGGGPKHALAGNNFAREPTSAAELGLAGIFNCTDEPENVSLDASRIASTVLSQHPSQRIIVEKFTSELDGTVVVPGSKSITNRALMMALCGTGASTIRNPLDSDDTRAGLAAAQALGCQIDTISDGVVVHGIGRDRPVTGSSLNVQSAGTVARFLPCVLAMGGAGEWTIVASKQMTLRPMKGLFDALDMLGDCIRPLERPGYLPAVVRGAAITKNEAFVDGSVSSQYLSGLLIAAPQAEHPLVFRTDGHVVQRQYVDITLDCMRSFGAEVEATSDLSSIRVQPTGYAATDFQIEADASTASYFAALPAALKGSLVIPNAVRNSRQPDVRFLELVGQLGCDVTWLGSKGVRISRPTALSKLKGGFTFNLNDCSDIALTVAALAPYADAPIEIQGVAHIRNHECDRVDAMTHALSALGIQVEERADGWKIFPGSPRYAEVQTRDDHRMAMSLSVLGAAGDGVSLDHPQCVAKTCPEFYRLISQLGLAVRDTSSD